MEVQARLEDLSTVKKKLTIEVPPEVAGDEFDRLAKDFKKYARIPGFRPGHAPLQLVKRRFFDDIRSELLQKLVPDSYNSALEQQQVQPISQPNVGNVQFQEGQPLRYEAVFEVLPEVILPEYKGLQVSVEVVSVEEEDVERELEAVRDRNASLVAVDGRASASGDYVTIDLKGEYLDEGPASPIDEEGVVVELDSERVHPAFNEHLPGLNIGEEARFEVQYEDDYPEEKLAGRRVAFVAEVTDIKERVLPELNDDLARDIGEFESLEALRGEIRDRLVAELEGRRQEQIQKALVDQMIAAARFEVPEVMVEGRIDRRVRDLAYRIASQGVDPTRSNVDWQQVRDEFREDAEKEARAGLLLEEIARREGLQVESAETDLELDRIAAGMQQPVEKVRRHFSEEGRLEGLKLQLLRRKALQLVVEAAGIE